MDRASRVGFSVGEDRLVAALLRIVAKLVFSSTQEDLDRMHVWSVEPGKGSPKRIGSGASTALGLARASDSLVAGVDYAGVHDWVSFMASIGLPIEPGEASRTAFQSSPLATVDQWKSPVLIVQADDDRSVPSTQENELITALRRRHVEHETLIIPNEIHDLMLHSSWLTLFHATDDYFGRKLDNR
jgi:pimeloyl-ACP methyl ester carboxylesterase